MKNIPDPMEERTGAPTPWKNSRLAEILEEVAKSFPTLNGRLEAAEAHLRAAQQAHANGDQQGTFDATGATIEWVGHVASELQVLFVGLLAIPSLIWASEDRTQAGAP